MSSLFEYKREMSALQFTPEQKKTLAQAAADAARKQTKKSRRPLLRTALIAAAMAVVLVVGSSAAGILPVPADVFAPLFGGNVAQTEVIDKIGHPIGASATDNGITITADAIMGDEYNAVIVYTLTRDDGERFFPADKSLDKNYLMMGGFGGGSWVKGGTYGTTWFTDQNPEDHQIQMVETVSSDKPLTHGTATAEFQDLCYWNGETEQSEMLYSGHWKFRFDVDYEDCAVHLDGGQTFSQNGLNFTIDAVSISPLAVKVNYTADAQVQWSSAGSGQQSEEDARQSERYLENIAILLTKTDGTVMDLSNSGGGLTPENGVTVCHKGQVFEEIIPLEDMASLSVGGIVYEIPHA